ncbi:extracellular serine/threonine protein kinase four-jointed-like [Uloborus diversus]|uniref:extracellular serine/threonine protein kinase four-jointed-like n=1 Tax=Uloborus diversus TaxID=327109 RepID=UPI00240A7521|nr:extracellular serine/threonine protein kinase four-jointed-like [Uloborus diversus]
MSPRTSSDAAADFLLRHPAVTEPSKLQHLPREKSGLAEAPNAGELAHTPPIPLVKPISNLSARESHNSERFMKNAHIGRFPSHSSENASSVAVEDVVNGIFWTAFAEGLVPKGFDEEDIIQWKRFLNVTEVLKIEEGCGRMQNRLVTLAEGGKSCCRYRYNNDQIQGEIFSFYLGKLLGIKNLAPSSLALVDPQTTRWSSASSQIALAQWNSEKPVVLTQFVEKLQPAFVPRHFRDKKKRRLHPLAEDIKNLTLSELSEVVQWSDLVIFDYLTANLDRAVNNMYNERWNADMMNQPTHNLAKTPEGLLLFLDNESGLLHGYRLLEKYEHFHKAMLDSLCIFKKDTIDAVEKLHRDNNLETVLKSAFVARDPGTPAMQQLLSITSWSPRSSRGTEEPIEAPISRETTW